MTGLLSIEYPHWLMIAGGLLLMLGLAGRQRSVDAELSTFASDPGASEPEANLNQVEVYNRTAKEKRKDRWAERSAGSEEQIDLKSEMQGQNDRADLRGYEQAGRRS
jgi:hypothetical protein